MSTYLITGGEGFIGYHICKQLSEFDDVDNIITYDSYNHYIPLNNSNWPEYQRYRNKKLDNLNIIRIRGDMNNRGLLKETLKKYKPDKIIHLAALPIANISNKYPYEARKNILNTSLTLMDVIRELKFDVERVIYTSSSMVYGDFNTVPAHEDDSCSPLGMYGAMKLSGEHIVRAYSHRFDIPHVIIRPSAVYGPTDCNRRVTEIFLTNAIKGKSLRLDNGGTHKLDFTYVKDLAKGFVLASTNDNAKNKTFNLTRGEGRQIKELAMIIQDMIPETTTYIEEKEIYRPNRGALDITRAEKILDYSPQYSLEKGINEYYEFINEVNII